MGSTNALAIEDADTGEKNLFLRAVSEVRQDHESRRRRTPSFLDEDFSTIAMVVLKESFWPFPRYPVCTPANKPDDFPCAVTFPDVETLPYPRDGASHWDLLHQLTHWCLPLEGHNEHFRSLFAALVEQAFGLAVSRRLCRRYDEQNVPYYADWLGPVAVRKEFLHPFVRTDAAEAPSVEFAKQSPVWTVRSDFC